MKPADTRKGWKTRKTGNRKIALGNNYVVPRIQPGIGFDCWSERLLDGYSELPPTKVCVVLWLMRQNAHSITPGEGLAEQEKIGNLNEKSKVKSKHEKSEKSNRKQLKGLTRQSTYST